MLLKCLNSPEILSICCCNVDIMLKCVMLMYIVHKPMDTHIYLDIGCVWFWGDISAHGYLCGRDTKRLMDIDIDLVLLYLSKPTPLLSLIRKFTPK
jgi:hypothetical protein